MKNLFNIQCTKKFPFIKVSKKDFFAIFMIVSALVTLSVKDPKFVETV